MVKRLYFKFARGLTIITNYKVSINRLSWSVDRKKKRVSVPVNCPEATDNGWPADVYVGVRLRHVTCDLVSCHPRPGRAVGETLVAPGGGHSQGGR